MSVTTEKPRDLPVYEPGSVPPGLATRADLRQADLPRRVGDAPVRAYRARRAGPWLPKPEREPLYAVEDTVPDPAPPDRLAKRVVQGGHRHQCRWCGAHTARFIPGTGVPQCRMCRQLIRIRDRQASLIKNRPLLAAWAREVLADQQTVVVWVDVVGGGQGASGAPRAPIAARISAVSGNGEELLDVTVQLARRSVPGLPPDCVALRDAFPALISALSGRRVVVWEPDVLAPVLHRLETSRLEVPDIELAALPEWPGVGGPYRSAAAVVTHWRGELDPATGQLVDAWPPGDARRFHLLLQWMAGRDARETPLLDFPEPRAH